MWTDYNNPIPVSSLDCLLVYIRYDIHEISSIWRSFEGVAGGSKWHIRDSQRRARRDDNELTQEQDGKEDGDSKTTIVKGVHYSEN